MLNFEGLQLNDTSSIRSINGEVKEIILVDSSWMIHRCYEAYSNLSHPVDGKTTETGSIYGYGRMVDMLARNWPNAAIIIALDDRRTFRNDIFPEYKAGRPDSAHVYEKHNELLQAVSLLPNVYTSFHPNYEADDIMYTMSQRLKAHFPVYVYCRDNDLMQCIGDNVWLFDKFAKGKMQLKGIGNVIDRYGVKPEALAMLKAIQGDGSDAIPGFKRFPKDVAQAVATICEKPEHVKHFDASEFSKARQAHVQKLIDNLEMFERNFSLVKLQVVEDMRIYKIAGTWEPFDKYGMVGLKRKFEEVLSLAK